MKRNVPLERKIDDELARMMVASTPNRLAVVSKMLEQKTAFTVSQIFDSLKRTKMRIDLGTIRSIFSEFAAKDVIQPVEKELGRPGPGRRKHTYQLNLPELIKFKQDNPLR